MTKNVRIANGMSDTVDTRMKLLAQDTRESLYSKLLIEKAAKNRAYAFILSSGLLDEFVEFSRNYEDEADTVDARHALILVNC